MSHLRPAVTLTLCERSKSRTCAWRGPTAGPVYVQKRSTVSLRDTGSSASLLAKKMYPFFRPRDLLERKKKGSSCSNRTEVCNAVSRSQPGSWTR